MGRSVASTTCREDNVASGSTLDWPLDTPHLAGVEEWARSALSAIPPVTVPAGTILFHPGDAVKGYVLVLDGIVSVHLVGLTGRGIVLYRVAAGQSCIQSTLGLLGGDNAYSAEAVADTESRLVVLPRTLFLDLLDRSAGFRALVFAAFADRMQEMMRLLERLSFGRVSQRLARALLEQADAQGVVTTTQKDLAEEIGSAREVIARNLAALQSQGLLRSGRGRVTLTDRAGLGRIAAGET
jgi:CRP/FNR family transcriptional regulator, anaerobic regulatory protein